MEILITKIERCLPENIIMTIWFNSSKTIDGVTVNINDSFRFSRNEYSPEMLSYEEITEDIAKQWIIDKGIEDKLDLEIYKLNNPATAIGIPWE